MKTSILAIACLVTMLTACFMLSGCDQGPAVVKAVGPSPKTTEGTDAQVLKPLK